jgi:sulfate adenylyltransferase
MATKQVMNKSIKQTVVGSVSRGTRALGAKRTHTVVSKNAAAVNAARKVAPTCGASAFGGSSLSALSARSQHKLGSSLVSKAAASVASMVDGKAAPHGGELVDLMVTDPAERSALLAACEGRTIELSDRNACDVELLMVGGFSPLTGFMNEEEYKSVVETMRLPSGTLFGLPVVMDTNDTSLATGMKVLLTYNGQDLAVFEIESSYKPNKPLEAKQCYGTSSLEHPGVQMISMERGSTYLGGKVFGLEKPTRVFPCKTPAEVREMLPANVDVVAFQCRNPVHKAHYELFTRALDAENVGSDGVVLVHPTCGPTQDDDIPGVVRYRTYEVLKEETADPKVNWAYLPYSMHMAGPREAIQHMIIRKNYGCTHFIIGRDMAGSKSCLDGEDFYGAYDAQDLAKANSEELGVQTVPSLNIVFTEEEGYVTADVATEKNLHIKKLSGTKFRKMLRAGEDIPEWFAFKSVVKVLRENN